MAERLANDLVLGFGSYFYCYLIILNARYVSLKIELNIICNDTIKILL